MPQEATTTNSTFQWDCRVSVPSRGGWTCAISHVTRLHSNSYICILHVVRLKKSTTAMCHAPKASDVHRTSSMCYVCKASDAMTHVQPPLNASQWDNFSKCRISECGYTNMHTHTRTYIGYTTSMLGVSVMYLPRVPGTQVNR